MKNVAKLLFLSAAIKIFWLWYTKVTVKFKNLPKCLKIKKNTDLVDLTHFFDFSKPHSELKSL